MMKRPDSLQKMHACLVTQVVLVISCLLLGIGGHAEPFFYFDYIDEDEGLSSASVEDIAQDQDGYIWFATTNGIFKYDGLSSTAYRRDGAAGSLLDGDIFDLLITNDNTLWAGTNGAGLARLDAQTNTFMHISNDTKHASIAHFRVRKLAEYNESILVLTDLGIEALDPISLSSERYPLEDPQGDVLFDYYPQDMVFYRGGILTVVSGRLYFMSEGESVFRPYGLLDHRHYAYSPEIKHQGVFGGGDSNVYLHTEDGLFVADQDSLVIKREPFSPKQQSEERVTIRNMTVDRHGTRWLVTRNHGLFYRSANSETYQKLAVGNGRNQLNTDQMLSLFIDIDKNIWIGTDGMYAAKTRAPQDLFPFYSNYQQADIELHTNAIWSFAEWNEKTYVTTHKGLFELKKDQDLVLKPLLTGAKYHFSYDVEVVDDELLFVTRQGLIRYQKNGVVTNISKSILGLSEETKVLDADFSQIESTDDHLFIGGYEGLIALDKMTQTVEWFHRDGDGRYKLKDNWAWMLKYDAHNQWLWVGTTSGVQLIPFGNQAQDTVEAQRVLDVIKDSVHDVFIQPQGEAWIATSLGLYRFTPQQELVEYQHFAESNIRAIQIRDDQLWLSTANGLIQTSLTDTNNYQYFIREDGVYNVMNGEGAAYYSASEDVFYFGGNRGIVEVRADEPVQVQPARKPVLEQVVLMNQAPYPNIRPQLEEGQALDFSDNSLRFHYAYLDYKAPHRIRFQYKLEGFDKDWSSVTEQNSVSYTNLASGKYQFYLRTYNANNLVSEEVMAIEFTIRDPWWRSNFAYLVYTVLLGFLALYILNYLRTHNHRQRQIQLQRKRQEFISSYSEYSVLLASLSSYQAMARHFLDRIVSVSGAKHASIKQTLLEEDLLIEVGDEHGTKFADSVEHVLRFRKKQAQLVLNGVNESELQGLSGDINLLYQQMILAQDNLIERTKYKWVHYHDARTSLFTGKRFCRILTEEVTRAEIKGLDQVVLFWQIDTNDFLQNNLIERIHLMKYGELIKESLGKHVIAAFVDQDVAQTWLDGAVGSGFVVYLADSSQQLVTEVDRKIRELVRVYKSQQPSISKNNDLQIMQINDIGMIRSLCDSMSAEVKSD